MDFNINEVVSVTDKDKVIIAVDVKVTAISPCKQWIQTSAGLAYMPASQIIKSQTDGKRINSNTIPTGGRSLQPY